MRRCRKPVDEDDRLSLAARSRGVVVQPRAREIEELASHEGRKEE
jgi:hypothetical protein